MRYIGAGRFLSGVPARDLSLDEWRGLSRDLRRAALARGLYKRGYAPLEE
jgi:hypothetical protein